MKKRAWTEDMVMERRDHPESLTCGDCIKFSTCSKSGIAHHAQVSCEWEPTHFRTIKDAHKSPNHTKRHKGGRHGPDLPHW